MPNFPKKQQQCLIPKYLLDYATDLQENHPDPSDPWGGGGGGTPIEAGTGIVITGDETKTISVDTEDVAMVADLSSVAFSGDYDDLTDTPDLTNYVDKSTSEEIGGLKTFTSTVKVQDGVNVYDQAELHFDELNFHTNDWITRIQPNSNLSMGEANIELPEQSGTLALQSEIPTDLSDLYNDVGYITGITSSDVSSALGYTPYDASNPSGYITGITSTDVVNALGYTPGTSNFSGDYDDLTNKPTLATVATTGDYDDLINKPTIPTNYVTTDTQQTISGMKTFSNTLGSTWKNSNANGFIMVTPQNIYISDENSTSPESLLIHENRIAYTSNQSNINNFRINLYDNNSTGVGTYTFRPNKKGDVAITSEIPDAVSGTNDGTNWTTLTIGNNTYGLASGGSTYTAGTGIDITNDEISVDNTVAMKTDIPDTTHMVTDNTAQDITGAKTFKGEDKLILQGATASQKPGFAILDGNDDKRGFLELRPGTNDKTMVLGVYNNNNFTDTSVYRIGLREYNQSYSNYTYSTLMPKGSDKYSKFGSGNMNMVLGVNGQVADSSGNVSLTIPTVTNSITSGSTDAVTSGAVYNAIGNIETLLAAI